MNPFFFEIVRGRYDRYFWQLVTYLGGDRDVIARSARDWGSGRKARKAAKAVKSAACSARIVTAPPRPGDIRFVVLKDVQALHVTGYGDTDGNGHRSAPAPAALQTPVDPKPAEAEAAAEAEAEAAPASNGEAGKTTVTDGRKATRAAPAKTSPRKTAPRTRAAAARS